MSSDDNNAGQQIHIQQCEYLAVQQVFLFEGLKVGVKKMDTVPKEEHTQTKQKVAPLQYTYYRVLYSFTNHTNSTCVVLYKINVSKCSIIWNYMLQFGIRINSNEERKQKLCISTSDVNKRTY